MRSLLLVLLLPLAPAKAVEGEFMDCPAPPVWSVLVRAMSPKMTAFDGLTASDFAVRLDGKEKKICGFSHSRMPASVGIVLDTSASMRGSGFDMMKITLAGVERLLDLAGPGDEYFLMHVSEDPTTFAEFTTDVARIRAGLRVTPHGKTALFDAIHAAVDEMRKARYVARAIVVFSDGGDNLSAVKERDMARRLSSSPVPIFVLAPKDPRPRRNEPEIPPEVIARERVAEIASKSGGYALASPDLASAAGELVRLLHTPYVLYFAGEFSGWELDVQTPGRRPRPALFYRGARILRQ